MFEIEEVPDYFDSSDEEEFGYYNDHLRRPLPYIQNVYKSITSNIESAKDFDVKSLRSIYEKEIEESLEPLIEEKMPKLVDLAATAVGKYYEPSDIVRCDPPLDDMLYKKVLRNVTPPSLTPMIFLATMTNTDMTQLHGAAISILKERGNIFVTQVGFVLIARFVHQYGYYGIKDGVITVTLEFAKQQITLVSCDACSDSQGCSHAFAAMAYRVYLPSLVKIYPPITETLSTMDRDDLQRLVQLFISDRTPATIEKCHQHIDDLRAKKYRNNGESELILDPTVSSSDAPVILNMYRNAIQKCISGLWETFNLQYFDGFDTHKRDIAKKFLKEAVHLCRLIPEPQHSLPLSYICAVGFLARNAHTREYNGCTSKKEALIKNSFCFLFDFMTSAACVFTQMQDRISIDTIDVEEWGQCIADCVKSFKECDRNFIMYTGDGRKIVTPQTLEYQPFMSLPRIYPLYEDKIKEVFKIGPTVHCCGKNLQDYYMSEVIASLFVPPPPEEYIQLVTDEDMPPEKSTYEEPLPVMMLRANAYDYSDPKGDGLSEKDNLAKMKVVEKIIMKLGEKAFKYSILSIYCKSPDFDQHLNRGEDDSEQTPFEMYLRKALKVESNPNSRYKKRYSLRKKRSSMTTIEPSTPEPSPKRKRTALKVNNSILNNVTESTDDSNKIPDTSTVRDVGNKHEENTPVLYPDAGGDCSRYSLRNRRSSLMTEPPASKIKPLLDNADEPADDNMSRERLCHLLLYWLAERNDLILHPFYIDSHDNFSPTSNVINGIHCLTVELCRFRLTKGDYTEEEHAFLWKLEKYLLDDIHLLVDGYEWIWRLYISAWNNLGFDHYGEHFPVVLCDNLSSTMILCDEDGNKGGFEENVFIGYLRKFMMRELKVKYIASTVVLYHEGPVPMMEAWETVIVEYLKSDEDGDYFKLCQDVVDAYLHSGEKTKVRVLYDALVDISERVSPYYRSQFEKNDNRGYKLKLRVAFYLCHVYTDTCSQLTENIKRLCELLCEECMSVLEDCSKDPLWKGKHVVKRCYNIQLGNDVNIYI